MKIFKFLSYLSGKVLWIIKIYSIKLWTSDKMFSCNFYSLPQIFFKKIFFYFYFILLYNTVLVLPYIDMNQSRVYMISHSWTPLPPPTPYHLSGLSPCTSPKHPISNIDWRFISYLIVYMFQCHSPKSSHPLPLRQSLKVHSIHLCLFCCPAHRIVGTIFLDSIYMCCCCCCC